MKPRSAILALVCSGALAGCTALGRIETQEPAPWVQAGVSQPATNAESLLLYYQHIRKQPAADLSREYETVRQAYARSRTDFSRIRLAMVLSLPNTAVSDEGRAMELLEPVSKNQGSALQGLAYLLVTQLQERKRLDANAQGLQQKLDALRTLERSMIERTR